MWSKIYCYLFILLFMVDNAFAASKAIESAQKQFSKNADLTWFIIAGIVAAGSFIVWLIISARKGSKKTKKR